MSNARADSGSSPKTAAAAPPATARRPSGCAGGGVRSADAAESVAATSIVVRKAMLEMQKEVIKKQSFIN